MPLQIHWMRAARTDKGVSAVGQVVSLKVVPSEGLVERINQHLPPQVGAAGAVCALAATFSLKGLRFRLAS